MILLQLPLWLLQAVVLLFVAHLWAPVLVRTLLAGRHRLMIETDRTVVARQVTRFLVLTPAHNEAAIIGQLAASLAAQDYPADRWRAAVIADNCRADDATAAIARAHGLPAYERTSPPPSNKSQALRWFWWQHRTEALSDPDTVILVLDADCTVPPNFLHELDRAFATGASVVQAHRTVGNTGASATADLETAVEELRQQAYGAARRMVGLSAHIMGTGMAFRAPLWDWLLQKEELNPSFSEDHTWQTWLIEAGHSVLYWPLATMTSEAVPDAAGFRTQRTRWIGDRLRGIVSFGWPLFLAGIGRGDPTRIDQGLSLMLPPRAVLGLATLLFTALAALWPAGSILPWTGWLFTTASLGLYLIAGFLLVRAPLRAYTALTALPMYVLNITRISLQTVTGRASRQWGAVRGNEVNLTPRPPSLAKEGGVRSVATVAAPPSPAGEGGRGVR